jgi:hypothetical protein
MNIRAARSAVVRLDPARALVARVGRGGPVSRRSIERGADAQSTWFARIVDATGDDQVIVLGPPDARLAFEREYVQIRHRPDRLVDVPA